MRFKQFMELQGTIHKALQNPFGAGKTGRLIKGGGPSPATAPKPARLVSYRKPMAMPSVKIF